jgi:polysaccharide export outer membrane protein
MSLGVTRTTRKTRPRYLSPSAIVSRSLLYASLLLGGSACSGTGSYVWIHDLAADGAVAGGGERINPGDLLDVRVFGQETMSTRGRVRPDGTFTLPLLGEVGAAGKKPAALARELERRLTPFINAPSVTVVIEEAPVFVTVVGEVKAPSVVQLEGPPTVVQALARAGGLSEFASKDDIFVLRQDTAGTPLRIRFTYLSVIRGERGAGQFRLRTGDVVVVE